jgi:CRISPR system Cascade subunit CasB
MSPQQAQAALRWWRALVPDPDRANPTDRAGDRAALARLRRCASLVEAMQEPETIALFRACGCRDERDLVPAALAAAVLAHVRKDAPGRLVARQLGPNSPERPESAVLKPLRFRRLLEAREPDDCLAAFRRLVGLAGGVLNVEDLAEALLAWLHPYRGDECRRHWIFAYWNANPVPAQPAATHAAEGTAA